MTTTIRIAVTQTKSGKRGYALRTFNQHSQAWQWIGEIHTGPMRWARVQRARAELIADLNDMQGRVTQ
jgi:hypothetical protein